MGSEAAFEKAALLLLLVLEAWLFSGSFSRFFTHDSLFYLIHAPQSWQDLWRYLAAPGEEKNYRPLNMAVVGLLRPWLGLDPVLYHWVPPAFHLANTALFYFLARQILGGPVPALAAAAFWGLHSVAGWITYDITYLSDFLLAFLLLGSLLLGVEARRRNSPGRQAASLFLFLLSLLTKESAVTFPLAVWLVLALFDLRSRNSVPAGKDLLQAMRQNFGRVCLYAVPAAAFAGLFLYWQQSGQLYTRSTQAAYSIDPWSNPAAKLKYVYWALNLPDGLHLHEADRIRKLIFASTGLLFLVWLADLARRRFRLSAVEWAGIAWFFGLNLPSLLLSSRLGKWYLYLPLFGVSLLFAVLAERLSAGRTVARLSPAGGILLVGLLVAPHCYSSLQQTRSYLAASDAQYQSEILEECLNDFREAHPVLPAEVNLFFLPAFDDGISQLLSVPPIDRGQLFGLFYPQTRIRAFFAHKGERPPADFAGRSDWIVLQFLDRHLYDVSRYFREGGKMTLFLLPTSEGTGAPLLEKIPAGGRSIYGRYVDLSIGDQGAVLPEDYLLRRNIWVLQYLDGHFDDVTSYYYGRQPDTLLLLPTIDGKVPPIRSLRDCPSTADRLAGSRVRFLSSAELARLPEEYLRSPQVSFFQEVGGTFYDVSSYLKPGGKMTLFLLPTFEGRVPLPVRRDPLCRNRVCRSPVETLFADEGARLPDSYREQGDLWILQYMSGTFSDVTGYYKGRRLSRARRVIPGLEGLRWSVDRSEFYPDYERFGTPTGAPVFFPLPGKEIVTQIGASTLVAPLGLLEAGLQLRFDVSWMNRLGDGAWAEAALRTSQGESVLFREYMHPDPGRKSLFWREVKIDLQPFAGREAELILKCTNAPGNNTVADWLNWRDIVLEPR